MKNVQYGLVFQNLSDLVLKEMYGIYETKNLKEQIEDELSKKSNKTKLSQQKSTKATIFCAQKLLKGGNLLFCVS